MTEIVRKRKVLNLRKRIWTNTKWRFSYASAVIKRISVGGLFFMKKNLIFKIVYCSIMAAMAFVCTFFEIPLFGFNITLYGIPLIFVGIVCGPVYGLLTGLIAGVLEQLKWGISVQTIFWLIAPMVWGGLSGLLYNLFKKIVKDNKLYKKIIIYSIVIIITAIIANVSNTFAMVVLGYSSEPITNISLFLAYAIPRLISVPIHIIIYIPICYMVCDKFKKIKFMN